MGGSAYRPLAGGTYEAMNAVNAAGVAVEIVPGPIIPSGGARIGVAGGDLDVQQSHVGVETGRDEAVASRSAGRCAW